MTTYTATIRHHSISRALVLDCGNNPSEAIDLADDRFGDGFLDHEIVIYATPNSGEPELFAYRRIGDKKWMIAP